MKQIDDLSSTYQDNQEPVRSGKPVKSSLSVPLWPSTTL